MTPDGAHTVGRTHLPRGRSGSCILPAGFRPSAPASQGLDDCSPRDSRDGSIEKVHRSSISTRRPMSRHRAVAPRKSSRSVRSPRDRRSDPFGETDLQDGARRGTAGRTALPSRSLAQRLARPRPHSHDGRSPSFALRATRDRTPKARATVPVSPLGKAPPFAALRRPARAQLTAGPVESPRAPAQPSTARQGHGPRRTAWRKATRPRMPVDTARFRWTRYCPPPSVDGSPHVDPESLRSVHERTCQRSARLAS